MENTQLVEDAKTLLAIESTSEQPDKLLTAVDFIASSLMRTPGVSVEKFISANKPSFLAYFGSKRPAKFDLLLNAHVDVVPGDPGQFMPTVEDGKLYARGAADMKVAALVMSHVFTKLGSTLPISLGLQIVSDEEVGGHNGTLYQISQGIKADFVLIGEDTPANSITIAMCGMCWAEVEFSGRAAHSGYVWKGDNAILQANAFINALTKAYPAPKTDTWQTTVNVAKISSTNTVLNRVPDEAKVGLDFRYVPEDDNFSSAAAVETFLKSLSPKAKIKVLQFEPSHSIEHGNPYLSLLAASAEQVTGKKPILVKRHGAADVRFFSGRGMAAATMGLPDNSTHGPGEYVELIQVEIYRQILEAFLQSVKANSQSPDRSHLQKRS